jgi:hypothetical protein
VDHLGHPETTWASWAVCGVADKVGSAESTMRSWLDYDAIALAVLAFGLVAVELLAFAI